MNRIIKLIENMPKKNRQFLLNYMKNAPEWIGAECKVVNYPEKHIFIREKEPVSVIHILVEGEVKATDYRIPGISYDFFWFRAVEIFGAMEAFIEQEEYMTTLITNTPCKFIIIRKQAYMKWMKQDAHALYIQSGIMTKYLLEQARRERIYLRMQAGDRMDVYFHQEYLDFQNRGICRLPHTRQEMADATGLSVKTINRNIRTMEDAGYIDVRKGKVRINKEQSEAMKERIHKKMYQDNERS